MIGQGLLGALRRRRKAAPKLGTPNALSGYFEMRVTRITGWVRDSYTTDADEMHIKIVNRGDTIAEFAARSEPERQRFVFDHPIDGQFSSVDLIKEDVIVLAYDSNGNGGRVLLDGAAQIELIRECLGVPADNIMDLDFSRGGNATPYLGAGWSGAETDFTWTDGAESIIRIDTPTDPGAYVLRMTAGALVRKPKAPEQEATILINGNEVGRALWREGHPQFHEIKFDHEAFGDEPATTLCLRNPYAMRPCEISDSEDRRLLALNFKRMTLVRMR